jgi:hypothetical protein
MLLSQPSNYLLITHYKKRILDYFITSFIELFIYERGFEQQGLVNFHLAMACQIIFSDPYWSDEDPPQNTNLDCSRIFIVGDDPLLFKLVSNLFPDDYQTFGGSDHKFGSLEYCLGYVCKRYMSCDCFDHLALEVRDNNSKLKVGPYDAKKEAEEGGEVRCFTCQGKGVEGKKMPSCSACKTVFFCGKECQRKGWKTHKKRCAEIQKEKKK